MLRDWGGETLGKRDAGSDDGAFDSAKQGGVFFCFMERFRIGVRRGTENSNTLVIDDGK